MFDSSGEAQLFTCTIDLTGVAFYELHTSYLKVHHVPLVSSYLAEYQCNRGGLGHKLNDIVRDCQFNGYDCYGRIRLGRSERKYSLVRSFFHSTGPPHEWFRIFRAYERPGVASCENSSNHVTHKRRPAEFEIRLERPAGFDVRLERSIILVS